MAELCLARARASRFKRDCVGSSGATLCKMREYKRQSRASSEALMVSHRSSSAACTGTSPAARVTLPSDLSGSLKYLDDTQLQRLLEAVTVEIGRRNQSAAKAEVVSAQTIETASQSPASRNKIGRVAEIPAAKENLIRASFRAGLKPPAIARMLRIPQPVVNRVLSSTEKPKR